MEIVGLETQRKKCGGRDGLSVNGITSAEVVPLENSVLVTSIGKERTVRVGLLRRAMRSPLESL